MNIKLNAPNISCKYCGKGYSKKSNFERHISLCELLFDCKNNKNVDDEEQDIPSQRKMYKMLLELGNKYSKLNEKMEDMNKWVVKKKKKVNVIEWLNEHNKSEIKFDNLIEKIIVNKEDVTYLFNNSFYDTLNNIFSRNIYQTETEYPIISFIQKNNVFYVYENEEVKWVELSREKIMRFLNRVHTKLLRVYIEWKKENSKQIEEDEKLSIQCDKTTVKMMAIDFNQESILSKVKSNMYSRMKKDMKGLIEYEFDF